VQPGARSDTVLHLALTAELPSVSAASPKCGTAGLGSARSRVGTIAAVWFALDGAAASTRQGSSRRRQQLCGRGQAITLPLVTASLTAGRHRPIPSAPNSRARRASSGVSALARMPRRRSSSDQRSTVSKFSSTFGSANGTSSADTRPVEPSMAIRSWLCRTRSPTRSSRRSTSTRSRRRPPRWSVLSLSPAPPKGRSSSQHLHEFGVHGRQPVVRTRNLRGRDLRVPPLCKILARRVPAGHSECREGSLPPPSTPWAHSSNTTKLFHNPRARYGLGKRRASVDEGLWNDGIPWSFLAR